MFGIFRENLLRKLVCVWLGARGFFKKNPLALPKKLSEKRGFIKSQMPLFTPTRRESELFTSKISRSEQNFAARTRYCLPLLTTAAAVSARVTETLTLAHETITYNERGMGEVCSSREQIN